MPYKPVLCKKTWLEWWQNVEKISHFHVFFANMYCHWHALFFYPIVHMYLSGTDLNETPLHVFIPWTTPEWHSHKTEWMGLELNTNTSPDRVTSSWFIYFSMWSESLWTREEERIKQIYYHVAKKVRAWQKPPVVRRSTVEWPPPSKACTTTSALDMGQAGRRHGDSTSLGTKKLLRSCWSVTFS